MPKDSAHGLKKPQADPWSRSRSNINNIRDSMPKLPVSDYHDIQTTIIVDTDGI